MKKTLLGLILISNLAYAADFTVQFSAEDNSISTVKIQDGAVTASKIAPLSIDDSKVSSISSSKISDIDLKISEFVPAGTTIDFAGDNCPVGYIKNDESSVSRTEYSNLFNAIGTSFGVGDGFSTFNLPKHDWVIDANIGGGNTNLGTAAKNSYSEIQGTSIDLTINSHLGSSSAEIACGSNNPSSGLTCSASNESIGIAFFPIKGRYEACFDFSVENGSNGAQNATFQLVETPNNSQTILQEGLNRLTIGSASASSTPNAVPAKVCGVFNFADSSKRTIRLMYEKVSTVSNPIVLGDRDPSSGQRDIHITVRPLFKIGKCIKF